MNLLLEPTRKRVVSSLTSDSDQQWSAPQFGESIPISAAIVCALPTPNGAQIWSPQTWTGWTNIQAAIGNGFTPPNAGTWYLLSGIGITSGTLISGKRYEVISFVSGDDFSNIGGTNANGATFTASGTTPTTWTHGSQLQEITANLPFNATDAQLQSALNATGWITSEGGITVTDDGGIFFFITWVSNGARTQFVGEGDNLVPLSIVETGMPVSGSSDLQCVQTVRLTQNAAAITSLSTSSSSASVTVTEITTGGGGANALYSVTISPTPYAGTFPLTIAGLQTSQIPYNDTGKAMQAALSALQQTSGTLVSGRTYVILTYKAGDSFTSSGASSNASGVVFVANSTAPTWTNGSILTPTGAGNVSVTQSGPYSWQISFQGQMANADMGTIGSSAAALQVISYLSGDLDLNTSGVEQMLGSSESVSAFFSIIGVPPGKTNAQELCRVPITINGPIIASDFEDQIYPNPIAYANSRGLVILLPGITGYTGGASNDLDSVPTTTLSVPWLVEMLHATDGRRSYALEAGTTAASGTSIIHPLDYNASTNAKIWVSQG